MFAVDAIVLTNLQRMMTELAKSEFQYNCSQTKKNNNINDHNNGQYNINSNTSIKIAQNK